MRGVAPGPGGYGDQRTLKYSLLVEEQASKEARRDGFRQYDMVLGWNAAGTSVPGRREEAAGAEEARSQ